MADKKITDLQLRDSVTDTVNYAVDDGIQSYRVTAPQIKDYVLAAGNVGTTPLADSAVTTAKIADANVTRGKLAVGGLGRLSVSSVSSTGSVSASVDMYLCNSNSAAFTLTLPSPTGLSGRVFTFKKTDASTNFVTILPNDTEKIDGYDDFVLSIQNEILDLTTDGTNWFILKAMEKTLVLKHTEAAGTAGGTLSSGSWATRKLNTIEGDQSFLVSLSSNQFTLKPGLYFIDAFMICRRVQRFQGRLRNITDNTNVMSGSSDEAASDSNVTSRNIIKGYISISAQKTFALQQQCSTTITTNGLGNASNFGITELYAGAAIRRIV
jgi:hypothetical protein